MYKTNISYSIKSIRQFSCSLYSLLNEEFRPNLNWPLFMFLLQTIEISSVLVNKLFKVTCYSKLESVESQVWNWIKHTFADLYLTVMFEVILSAIIDSRIILSLFYTPLQLLFKTKINSKTLRQVNSANYLIYECHQRQLLNFATYMYNV